MSERKKVKIAVLVSGGGTNLQALIDAEAVEVRGICHITGGGFYENVPRAVPDGFCARVDKSAIKTPPIFKLIQETGNIPERDMFNTFNMGVGMCVIVSKETADAALRILDNVSAYVVGEIGKGDEKVTL